MDLSDSSRELLDAVDLVSVPHLQNDSTKLGGVLRGAGTIVDSGPPPLHYITLPRSPNHHVLIDNALLSSDILGHHVVQGNLVVDMMAPQNASQTEYSQSHNLDRQYLSENYENELLSQDLTEDDRRLAAALVAVQLVQQQKQQNGHETQVIVNNKSDNNSLATLTPLSSDSVISLSTIDKNTNGVTQIEYLDADHKLMDHTIVMSGHHGPLKLYQQVLNETLQRLPPLKKTLNHGIRSVACYNLADPQPIVTNGTGNLNLITSNSIIHSSNMNHITNSVSSQSHRSPNLMPTNLTISPNDNLTYSVNNNKLINNHHPKMLNGNLKFKNVSTTNSQVLSHSGINMLSSTINKTKCSALKSNLTNSQPLAIVNQNNGTIPHLNQDVKEEMDFEIKSFKSDDDLFYDSDDQLPITDSDYDKSATSRQHKNRKSLPHKKRISRKLKNMKRSSNCRSKRTNKIQNSSMFSCQLCGERIEHQLNFFEHLKLHYEPQYQREESMEKPVLRLSKSIQMQTTEGILSEPHSILPTVEESHQIQDISNVITSSVMGNVMSFEINHNGVTLPDISSNQTQLLRCKYCSMSFKREKLLEAHFREMHLIKDNHMDEFSEPEDLLEGIRSVIEANGRCSDEDDDNEVKVAMCQPILKLQKDWYHVDELHATEADLVELEASQQMHSNQQFIITKVMNEPKELSDLGPKIIDGIMHAYICTMCGEKFSSKSDYRDHEHDCCMLKEEFTDGDEDPAEPGRPKLTCQQCGRQFAHRNSLTYHLQTHSGERPHQCEVCGKSFFAASALKVHMRMHSGQKPYQCSLCSKHFRQWGDLKYHVVSIHSEQKQFQCEFCGKDFARKYSLIVHRRIHTGEKNYKCEYCPKTFRASSYLQNHRRIHTGEKPYPCIICAKPFRVRGDMKRHMNTHTRAEQRASLAHKALALINEQIENSRGDIQSHTSEEGQISLTPKKESMTPTYKEESVAEMKLPTDIKPCDPSGESILPDESLNSPSSQPIDLNITADHRNHSPDMELDEARYTRDSAEREGNTFYVWPVYMT